MIATGTKKGKVLHEYGNRISKFILQTQLWIFKTLFGYVIKQ